MRILFLGDIVGRTGRDALEKALPELKKQLRPDIVIVNGENAAHGIGITEKICQSFYEWGTNIITTGNHVWDQREILTYIDRDPALLRPHNWPEGAPGSGICLHRIADGRQILVVNLMGRTYMEPMDDPFAVMKKITDEYRLGQNVDAIFVDFHAEATSEKMAFGHYFDGKISAIIGTHTHIPSADAQIFDHGTAYQTDAGMCGDYNSVIGFEKEVPIARFTKKMSVRRMMPADGEATICGFFVQTDKKGLATNASPVVTGPRLHNVMPDF